MSQDSKCAIGVHKYELIQQEQVTEHTKNDKGQSEVTGIIGIQMICRCANCGRIKSWFIPTSAEYINRSTRA